MHRARSLVVLALPGLLAACAAESARFASPDARPPVDTGPGLDARPPVDVPGFDVRPLEVSGDRAPSDDVIVYAHTATELFAVDPRTLRVMSIQPFGFPPGGGVLTEQMTDIAVTSENEIWGVSFGTLYRVNRDTAECTRVATLSGLFGGRTFNALTFVPAGLLGSREVLVAATREGDYFQIDTGTGAANRLGAFGDGVGASGDLVSVQGAGTFATVLSGGREYLASINPRTGAATLLGPTGIDRTWGLGYWRARLYGFTETGSFVTLDIRTGAASVVSTAARAWWGAGVTTIAPTAPP